MLVAQTSTTQWLQKMRCDIQVLKVIEKAIRERESWNSLLLLPVQKRKSSHKLFLSIIYTSESRIKHEMCPSPEEEASEGPWALYLPHISSHFSATRRTLS